MIPSIQKVILFLLIAIITACDSSLPIDNLSFKTRKGSTEIKVYLDSLTIVPAKAKVAKEDSLKKHESLKIDKPKTHYIYTNIHPAGIPTEHTIEQEPQKIFPAKDSQILLKTSKITGKRVSFYFPEPITAMPAHYKENASYDICNLNIDHGMSSSNVRALLKDSKGNLWIGTFDKGVSLYDGEHFTHFTDKEGLSSNTINTIFEDSKGNIWFGTWGGGACMYNGEYFTHYTEKEGFPENHIYSIFEDRQGNIWFGTEGQGICVYDGKQIKQFYEKNTTDNDIIRAISQDVDDNIWFATYAGGLLKYSVSKTGKESFVRYTEKDGLSSDYVWTVHADKKGKLWIGTNNGLDILYKNKFTNYTVAEGLNHNIVTKIIESRNGDIIIATRGNGASIFNGENFTYITKNEGLSDNIVNTIIEGENELIWLGTRNGGLNKYNPHSFEYITENNGLNDYPITSLLFDKNKNLWIGTSGGGICKYNDKTINTYTDEEGLSHNYIYSILEDKNGNIWIGTAGGGVNKLSTIEGIDFITHFGKEEGLSDRLILAILEDRNGNIWFSTKGEGVYCYNGTNFINYDKSSGLNNNTIFAMLEIQNGNIWFGTYGGGINIYDGKNFRWVKPKETLGNLTIFSLYEDFKNNIWIGTEKNGVLKYDGHHVIRFSEKDGLNSNLVGAIIEDKNHNLWIGTNKGLNIFQQKQDGSFRISDFRRKDGLKNLDYSNPSLCIGEKNQILWASGKEITIINPAKFGNKEKQPEINLQNIDINQEHIDFRRLSDTSYSKKISFAKELSTTFNKVASFTNYPVNLKLPYNINHLTFHFTANDRLSPHKIKYSYIMQGIDKKWSIPNKESKADYRNLPYGNYTFKVRAIGKDKLWSNNLEYSFIIQGPWWIKWWAYVLYFFALSLIIILIVTLRTKQLKKHEKILEKTVVERTKEVEQQKEKILVQNKELIKLDKFKQNMHSMIVHDLKTPLNNILSLTDAVEHGSKPPSVKNAHLIKQMGRQMLNLTLNILDVNKFEDAKIELQIKYIHLKTLINDAVSQINFLANQKNIQINSLVSDKYFVDCDKDMIERVLVNLLTNAIKYSPQNEKVIIECTKEKNFEHLSKTEMLENKLVISVKDYGEGISSENTDHIFEKFAQISDKKSGSVKSTGLGLTFCKLAVEAHGGRIGLNSKLTKGSHFWFSLKESEHQQITNNTSEKENKPSKISLSNKEIELLSPLLEKLEGIYFYEVTTLKKLLQEYNFSDNIVLQEWKNSLEHSVLTCNKQEYEATIAIGRGI